MSQLIDDAPAFAQLGVPDYICRALVRRGITEPFEIQARTIDDVLVGRDVCGAAPTGSGKTLAFGIPLVAATPKARPQRPRALVLSPTRELADQITTELSTLSNRTRVASVYGGVGYGKQIAALRQGVDILVACPGRLEDLLATDSLRLNEVERVVIDEADRMADMGFLPAVRRLLDLTTSRRQTVLFSATLDGDVAAIVNEYLNDPVRHEVVRDEIDAVTADHVFWSLRREDRVTQLAALTNSVWPAVVFTRTRHGADRLATQLERSGVTTVAIHGGRSQQQRTRSLNDFTNGRVQALIATDVAARGLHIDDVALVVHFDPPEDHKAYIHRSGRTARAGRGGVVVSFIEPNGHRAARRMQREVGIEVQITEVDMAVLGDHVDGDRPRPVPKPEVPVQDRRARKPQSKRNHGSVDNRNDRQPNGRGRGSADDRRRGSTDARGSGSADDRGRGSADARGRGSADDRGRGSAEARGRDSADRGSHGPSNGRKARPANGRRVADGSAGSRPRRSSNGGARAKSGGAKRRSYAR